MKFFILFLAICYVAQAKQADLNKLAKKLQSVKDAENSSEVINKLVTELEDEEETHPETQGKQGDSNKWAKKLKGAKNAENSSEELNKLLNELEKEIALADQTNQTDLDRWVKRLQRIKDAENSSEELGNLLDELKNEAGENLDHLEEQLCHRKGSKALRNAVRDSLECFKKSQDDNTICAGAEEQLKACTAPVKKTLESCVDAPYHDIPEWVVKIATSTVEYLCEAQGKTLIELVNPCTVENADEIQTCIDAVDDTLESSPKNLKVSLCSSVPKIKKCIVDEVNKTCKNELTKKSVADIIDAVLIKPCA